MTIVCGDSHTSTHGAFGTIAFGIGTSEVEMVLATQCLLQTRPKLMRINVEGTLKPGVLSKDIILHVIARISASGATGYFVEYAGSAIRALSMEGRMTICNMAIELGAKIGFVAPDDVTFEYLRGRPFAPKSTEIDEAVAHWRSLVTDPGAAFDREVQVDVSAIRPQVTWGTSPEQVTSVDGLVPDPADEANGVRRQAMQSALDYMGLAPATPIRDIRIDRVFIGSCTNSRLSD
jgi:3-isopropylmalate/(R)-2-methylmalate dehydratase large subunit